MYTRATDPPPRYQWEHWDSEPPNGSWNCNPTSTAYILDFYKDLTHHINGLRRAVGVPDGKTMTTVQVVTAMALHGVPAYKAQISLVTLKSLISSGRRPVLVGLWDAKVPASIRGHSFLGMHGIVAAVNAWKNGVSGVIVMDPNFNPPNRPDLLHGERFYPDTVMAAAMYDYNLRATSYSVVPINPKYVPAPSPVPPTTGYPRNLSFAAGTYTGRQFDGNGKIIASKAYKLPHSSSAPAKMRSRIKNQGTGYWYYITAGVWAGYWIPEGPGIS